MFCLVSLALLFISGKFGIAGDFFQSNVISVPTGNNASGNRLYIVIDAGHGGEDGGAVSDTGICEKDINIDIAKKLNVFLMLSDHIPVLVRDSDRLMYEPGQENRKKYHDISNRIKIADSYENSLLVSIHQNKFPIKKYSGFQVYYSKNHPDSYKLAQMMQDNVKNYLQHKNNRAVKNADKTIRLLDSVEMPAVLAECGFLSNDSEAELLNNEEYRNKLSYLLSVSVIQFAHQYEEKGIT